MSMTVVGSLLAVVALYHYGADLGVKGKFKQTALTMVQDMEALLIIRRRYLSCGNTKQNDDQRENDAERW